MISERTLFVNPWYVVLTIPRSEYKAFKFNTENLGIESYFPSLDSFSASIGSSSVKSKSALISSYLFFRQHPIDFSILNQNPFTKSVLRINNKIVCVSNEEIQAMKDHIENRYFKKDFHSGEVGSTIEIQKGVFIGKTARIVEKRKNKISLMLPSLQMQLILTLK